MKKILMILLAMVLTAGTVVAVLQVMKHLDTPKENISGISVKELEEEGWMVFGTSLPLETAVELHNELLASRKEIVAHAISTQMNIGSAKLRHQALLEYANQQAAENTDDMNGESTTTREVQVNGEVELSFMVYREKTNDKGMRYYEFQGYYTINPSVTVN
jgi:hypothetical protein